MKLLDKFLKRLGYVKVPKNSLLPTGKVTFKKTVEPVLLQSRKAFVNAREDVDSLNKNYCAKLVVEEIVEEAKKHVYFEFEHNAELDATVVTGTLTVLPFKKV